MQIINSYSISRLNLFDGLLFLYFLTLHADQLGGVVAGYNFRINNLFAIFLFLLLFFHFRNHLWHFDKQLAFSLIGITFSVALSCLLSPYPLRCCMFLGWYGWTILCYLLLPYFLVQVYAWNKIFSFYCASFVFVGSYATLQFLFSLFEISDPFAPQRILNTITRPNAFAYEPSFYALYMTPFIMLCNFHFISSPGEDFFCLRKLTWLKIFFLNVLYLISTSTSTIFAYIAFFIAVIVLAKRKGDYRRVWKFFAFLLLSGGALFAMMPFIIKNFYMKFFFVEFGSHPSFFQRWQGIKNCWNIFLENIFVGVGLGGCPPDLYHAWKTGNQTYGFFDEYLDRSHSNFLKYFEPSNVGTELLASLGLIGFGFFVYLLILLYKRAQRAIKTNSGISLNLLISLVIMLFVLQFNQGLLRTYVWVHCALCFAIWEKLASDSAIIQDRDIYDEKNDIKC